MKKLLLSLLSITLFAISFNVAFAQTFQASTTLNHSSSQYRNIGYADFDGDGDIDIYLSRYAAANELYLNNGDATFVAAHIPGELTTSQSFSVLTEDFDGDGDIDIFHTNYNLSFGNLWLNNGDATFVAGSNLNVGAGGSISASSSDLDGDGDIDIFIGRGVGNFQNQIWLNNGDATFTMGTLPAESLSTLGSSVADFDGDGDTDIYVANGTNTGGSQQNSILINDGAAGFTRVTISGDTGASRSPSVADFDGDGDIDIHVANNPGQNKLWINDGSGNFTANDIAGDSGSSMNSTAADIDGDGDIDIHVSNYLNQQNKLWINDGSANFTASDISGDSGNSHDSVLVDLDNNSLVDVYILNINQANQLYLQTIPVIITITPTPTTISNTTITDAMVTITSPQDNDITNIVLNAGTTGATLGTCTGDNSDTTDPYESSVTCTINNISASGTLEVSAVDSVTGAQGNNSTSFVIDTVAPNVAINTGAQSNNGVISDTVTVTDDIAINASDVSASMVVSSGTIAVTNLNCTQTNTTQVDCTVSIDNDGTANLQVDVTDVAGNTDQATAGSYIIDTIAPLAPATPDLKATSDRGSSDSDDITNTDIPTFNVQCTESNSTLGLYIDGTLTETYTCTAVGLATITLSSAFSDANYDVTLTETDSFGNQSVQSSALTVTIDTTIGATIVTTPTNGQPVVGTTDANANVSVSTPSGATCTTTSDASGNYSCSLAPSPVDGEDVTATATDLAGNTSSVTETAGIDTSTPTSLTIDNVNAGATTIIGTGEDGTTITLDIATCINAPVIVAGGVWSCTIDVNDAPSNGDTITATSTDTAGNTATASYTIPTPSSGGGSVRYICKDPEASNYNSSNFGIHRDSKCEYDIVESVVTPTESNPFGGEQCPANLIITDNMKQGDRDGQYGSYNQGIVTQVHLLQTHMNRLLLDEYGNQASGPVDGIFGPLTKQGVQRLQQRLNQLLPNMTPLVIDGIVGPFTKAAINQSCDNSLFEL